MADQQPQDFSAPAVPVGSASAPTIPVRPPGAKAAERRSLGRRSAALVRRWARDTFNREQLLSSLRALAWVAPLTLIIWIYAEREQQLPDTARFHIVVKSADPTQVANFVNPSDQNVLVMANLKGPKARLDKAKDMLDPRSGGGPVVIMIDGSRDPNQYEIDILAQIQKDFRIDTNGVTVEDCSPRYVRVDVDALQEVELVVRADPQIRFPTAPTFDPPVVKVFAPAAAVRSAKGEWYARANLPPLAPGPHTIKAVPVTVEGLDPKTPVRPATVSATLEVGQADEEYEIASVPVFPLVEVDPLALDSHRLRFDQFVSNVLVVGTPDKIKRLQDSSVKPRPKARFEVTDNDVGKQRVSRELKFELPEGISLKSPTPRTVTFDLLPKEPS